jgi:antitoxin (DNA-binding transcriptional repressor) of toxin-antitoxin stability system
MNVKVTELRQNLPSYLKRVRRGERIRVTSHGQVIAELAPPTTLPEEADGARKRLRGSLLRYDLPFEPVVPAESWSVNQ